MNNFNQQYRQKQDGPVHHVPKNRENFNTNVTNNTNNTNDGNDGNNNSYTNRNNNGNRYMNNGRNDGRSDGRNDGRPYNQNSGQRYNGYNNNQNNKPYQKYNNYNDSRQNKYNSDNYQNDAQKIVKNMVNDKFNDNINHDNDNDYLDNNEIKHLLLTYIYDTIELSNYKYKLLELEYDLPLLKEKKFYVSPNYNGIHSLLVFIKIKDKFLSFIVDRKTLTYNVNQIDYNKVKIIPVHYRLDESIYNGTILDGVLLYNNIDGLKHFVINDVYYFRGKDTTNDKITNKMLSFTTYLETIKDDPSTNNLIFILNKLYELKDIQQLVNVYIPKSKYNKSIKGISFYSEYSGTKLIYLYNNCSQDNRQDEPVHNNKFMNSSNKDVVMEKPKEIRQSNITITNDNLTAVFKMKKTETVDVYNLFLGEKSVEGQKKLFKYKKIDIAYIPTKECSFFCKDAMSKTAADGILVECKYDNVKSKWIPFKLITDKKRPDTIDKIEHIAVNNNDS